MEIHTLAPELITELQEVLAWYRNMKLKGDPYQGKDIPDRPRIYLARAPKTGIPAREDDPGSASPGSGTDSSIADVNSALCQCFRIDDSVLADIDVFRIDQQLTVWNFGATAIPSHAPLVAALDETGKWIGIPIVTSSGGGGGSGLTFVTSFIGSGTFSGSGISNITSGFGLDSTKNYILLGPIHFSGSAATANGNLTCGLNVSSTGGTVIGGGYGQEDFPPSGSTSTVTVTTGTTMFNCSDMTLTLSYGSSNIVTITYTYQLALWKVG